LGGTAYLIVENSHNILIDCPSWTEATQAFLQEQGGVQWLILSHRQGMSAAVAEIQKTFDAKILVQEQEAYLLPNTAVTTFQQSFDLSPTVQMFWTPGYSPGSSCVYYRPQRVLFTGRHLLPDQMGTPKPLRTAKTFHWFRQLNSVQLILDRFTAYSLHTLCPGANTGFLRQQRFIDQAYFKLQQLDLLALRQSAVGV
jgi:glyoxylase-like metal-dependent hydrolase (beta-lactamase superfamily II)